MFWIAVSMGLVFAATVDLDALFSGQLASAHQQGMKLTEAFDRNLTQGLGVVNTALIQSQGSVSDDPGLIAALQTASRVPVQGANTIPG